MKRHGAQVKKSLTDKTLRHLKAAKPGKRDMIWDTNLPTFGVRITHKGKATFIVMRRIKGTPKPKRWPLGSFVIGKYPKPNDLPEGQKLPLAAAREKARELIDLLDRGIDPDAAAEERQRQEEERRLAEARLRENSFAAVSKAFITRYVKKARSVDGKRLPLKSAVAIENAIARHLIPLWGERPITEIKPRDVSRMLNEVADPTDPTIKGRPFMARHLLAYTRKLFRWAIAHQEYGLEHSPCELIGASEILGPLVPRAHILTDDELKAVWDASAALPDPAGPFVRLLIATGQRLREVANMSWAEIDLDNALWVVSAARMKSGKAHEVPLSSTALEILHAVARFDDGPFVFTTTSGRRPISGFGKIKMRLDAAMAEMILGKPVPPWRFHDARRTMRTHIGGLPVPSDVAEMVIGHRPGGVRGTYDLHAYRTEKRRALELWAVRLKEIIAPTPTGNVMRLREVAR